MLQHASLHTIGLTKYLQREEEPSAIKGVRENQRKDIKWEEREKEERRLTKEGKKKERRKEVENERENGKRRKNVKGDRETKGKHEK